MRNSGWLCAVVVLALRPAIDAQVLTSQYNNARTGATVIETTLTPANVNAKQFGKLFSWPVDGDVYAQPLFLPRVPIGSKGTHDAVYIATEHDSVYAFDAGGQPREPLWHRSLIGRDETTVAAQDVQCPFIAPEIGITATPVLDRATGTLYVLARTKRREAAGTVRYIQRLHALDVRTGADKAGGPVEISASVNGSGGAVTFDPLRELPRAGLLLAGNHVYLTWGSSCDVKPYHGWVMAYAARTLRQSAVFNTPPDADEAGIWQSDMAPAADEEGHVYVATGNGRFDAASGGRNFGDSLLKLRLTNGQIVVRDVFTPQNERDLSARDKDLGSGGPVLLPDQAGRRLILIAGKEGPLHVLDRTQLKRGAAQALPLAGGAYAAPAYWNGHVFFAATNDQLQDFAIAGGTLSGPSDHERAAAVRQSGRRSGGVGKWQPERDRAADRNESLERLREHAALGPARVRRDERRARVVQLRAEQRARPRRRHRALHDSNDCRRTRLRRLQT